MWVEGGLPITDEFTEPGVITAEQRSCSCRLMFNVINAGVIIFRKLLQRNNNVFENQPEWFNRVIPAGFVGGGVSRSRHAPAPIVYAVMAHGFKAPSGIPFEGVESDCKRLSPSIFCSIPEDLCPPAPGPLGPNSVRWGSRE